MGMNQSKQSSSQGSESTQSIFGGQVPFLENLWSTASNTAMSMGNPFQGAMDQAQPFIDQAGAALGGLADPTAQIAAQEASLSAGLGNLFRNEINPAIESNNIAAGGLGGGRQGVAQDVATGQLANAYTEGLGQITANANQQAGMAGQALGNLGQLTFGMGSQGAMGALTPLQMLSQIIGSPTVLGNSTSWGNSKGKSSGFSFPGFGG